MEAIGYLLVPEVGLGFISNLPVDQYSMRYLLISNLFPSPNLFMLANPNFVFKSAAVLFLEIDKKNSM